MPTPKDKVLDCCDKVSTCCENCSGRVVDENNFAHHYGCQFELCPCHTPAEPKGEKKPVGVGIWACVKCGGDRMYTYESGDVVLTKKAPYFPCSCHAPPPPKNSEWEERFKSFYWEENYYAGVDQYLSFISKEIELAYEKGRDNKAPMGVSQWKNHGDKYGYSKFWEEKIRQELLAELIKEIEGMPTQAHNSSEVLRLSDIQSFLTNKLKK